MGNWGLCVCLSQLLFASAPNTSQLDMYIHAVSVIIGIINTHGFRKPGVIGLAIH